VAAILQARCAACHSPEGLEQSLPLTNYQEVQVNRRVVLSQVYGCLMPPGGETPLTSQERQTLLAWLVCGAPDN
jgi:uncharacterized membrane protein